MNWYIKVLKNYANFKGRARRMEYWMFTLFQFIITLVLLFAGGFFTATASALDGGELSIAGLIGTYIILFLYGLATFIPTLAVTVRRLHDTGKSGWWYFISFVPCIGGLWLLILLLFEGDNGPNEWGPNPKGEGNDRAINEIGRD